MEGRPIEFLLPATPEQKAICDSWDSSFRVRVQAGAGTGKTSTMKRLADVAIRAGFSVIYLAFNKQVQIEIQESYEKEAKPVWGVDNRQFQSKTPQI